MPTCNCNKEPKQPVLKGCLKLHPESSISIKRGLNSSMIPVCAQLFYYFEHLLRLGNELAKWKSSGTTIKHYIIQLALLILLSNSFFPSPNLHLEAACESALGLTGFCRGVVKGQGLPARRSQGAKCPSFPLGHNPKQHLSHCQDQAMISQSLYHLFKTNIMAPCPQKEEEEEKRSSPPHPPWPPHSCLDKVLFSSLPLCSDCSVFTIQHKP